MISGLFHPGCTVSNLEQALAFFGQTLGVEHVHGQVSNQPYLASVTGLPGCSLKLGFARAEGDSTPIELIECVHPPAFPSGTGFGIVGSAHPCWRVDSLDRLAERLASRGVAWRAAPWALSDGPWATARGVFLANADGFPIELVELPDAGGQAGRLLGVHHFGLTVSDIPAMLEFLCGRLGLSEVGRYASDGAYLRHAAGLDDAHMQAAVVAIPGSPVCIELWQFERPAGAPARVGTNAVASGHICFYVADIFGTHRALSEAGVRFAGLPAEVTAGVNKGAYAIYFWGPDGLRFELFQRPPAATMGRD
jgi:catechol 2,3-dioxygenase-like lactoylglutathione lyase family enzyme